LASFADDAYLEAAREHQEAAGPWFFGLEITYSRVVVSLLAGRGSPELGRMPFQQVDPGVFY